MVAAERHIERERYVDGALSAGCSAIGERLAYRAGAMLRPVLYLIAILTLLL